MSAIVSVSMLTPNAVAKVQCMSVALQCVQHVAVKTWKDVYSV